MKDFAYFQPDTLEQTLKILQQEGSRAKLIAGGTDLLVKMKRWVIAPPCLISLQRVKELDFLDSGTWGLRIGALTTLAALAKNPSVQQHYPSLAATAAKMASSQVRNLATVGGNICNAAPSADLAPPLIALEATVVIQGAQGIRMVPLAEFFTGPGATVLRPDELVTAFNLPLPEQGTQAVYIKHGIRKAMDIACVGVAVKISPRPKDAPASQSGNWEVRIVLGAVAPTPVRVQSAESLAAQGPKPEFIREAALAAEKAARPIDDVRSSAFYRNEMVRVLVQRGLEACWGGGEHA